MRKRFVSKKKKGKIRFFLLMILIGVFISYQKIEHSKLKISNKELIQFITSNTFQNKETLLEKLVYKTLEFSNPIRRMNQDYQKYIQNTTSIPTTIEIKEEPIIYLYNTHQKEEYASSTYAEFNVSPTVMMNDYILEDIFEKNGYSTVVEESSIQDLLVTNNWNYAGSYQASRILLEKSKQQYPSLKYFIDIHRDSLIKNRTTITIDGKDYAQILFIVGLENPTYQVNLAFTEKIHQKLAEYYPNLSKGIYKKSGYGVNGIYNQDFSPNTILVEIGGYENTTNEVLNTSLAFAKCFMEVIHE